MTTSDTLPFGGAGGGGGLTLGPAPNTFTAATRAAAEALRDAAATGITGALLAQYDAQPTFSIILAWPATPTNSVYQSRRSSAWADITGLVRGPIGLTGPQARFLVYAYVNSAVAPTVAPTGGTYVQSTGVLTSPVGYTTIPVTPVLTERTYRTQAVVNPANDADSVNLVWVLPSEAPEYDAAGQAEGFRDEAETARDLAEQYAGQAQDIPAGSPRGALVATSPTLPTASVSTNSVIAFGATELWTIEADAPDGFEAGPAANNERLYLPDIHTAGSNGVWLVVEVAGVEVAEIFISHGGIQGATGADRRAVIPVSLTADALIRTGTWLRSGATAGYLQLTGNADTLPANIVVKIYLAVVRGGDGGGPGGTNETNLAVENQDADSLQVTSDTGTDAELPSATEALAGLMSAADKTALGNAGGELRFGAVDPTAADGNNKDVWINTADGTIWKKAAGAWTKQYTFPSTMTGSHTRRIARSTDETLSEAEVTAGMSSTTSTVMLAAWGQGVLEHIFLGVPEDEADITDVEINGVSAFNGYEPYVDGSDDPIIVSAHKWWFTTDPQDGEFAYEADIIQ